MVLFSGPFTPSAMATVNKLPMAQAVPEAVPATNIDLEAAEYNDSVLLGHRSTAETIVLCFANLIPPLGVL